MTVHGAVFRHAGQGVLALGARGSGKSVLPAAALTAGAEVVSDDWVLMGRQDGIFLAERLRGFLMLRAGWAAQRLQDALGYRPGGSRPKSVLPIPDDDPRFPAATGIDRVWLLRRPRVGRSAASASEAATGQRALGELIAAAMPILFSRAFPFEREALMGLLRGLLATTPVSLVETGTDLVVQPAETMDRLLRAKK